MEEQPLDVRRALATLVRRRRIVGGLAALGLLAGLGAAFALPAPDTATALILLPSSPLDANGQPTRDVDTEIQIATSPVVLDAAGRQVRPRLDYNDALAHVAVVSITNDILQVTAKQPTVRRAKQLADGVANAFVSYSSRQALSLSGLTLALEEEATQIQRQLSDLQTEIASTSAAAATAGAGSAAGQRDASLLATLQQESQSVSLQFDSVQSQVAQAKLDQSSLGTGTTVLETATTAQTPSRLRPALWGLAGLAVGAVVGTVVALVVARRDRRLWRRDDIAAAVGAPVIGSLPVAAPHGIPEWMAVLRDWQPGVEETWAMRALLRRLSRGRMSSDLTVLSVAGDVPALAMGPRFAATAANLGVPTTFVDAGDVEGATELGLAVYELSTGDEVRSNLRVRALDDSPPTGWIGCSIGCVVVDEDDPRWPAYETAATTWLAVSPGRATARQLGRMALAAEEQGRPVSGVVVVNPDPHDTTTGRSPADIRPAPMPATRMVAQPRGLR